MLRKVVCRRLCVVIAAACALLAVPAAASAGTPGWVIQPTPTLPGLPPPAPDVPPIPGQGGFAGVSCATADFCAAVGQESPGDIPSGELAEVWDGTAWSITETDTLDYDFGSQLLSVSCAAPGACLAVGWGQASGSVRVPLARTLSATAAAGGQAPATDTIDELLSVSCVSASTCMAVGNGDGTAPYLIDSFTESGATSLTPAVPADGAPGMLTGVSCATESFCVAVGGDDDGNVLVETWDGTSWSLSSAPNPASSLGSISCPAVRDCVAIGAANGQPLVERLRHGTWEVLSAPPAASLGEPSLTGISCPTRQVCTVVGNTSDAANNGASHPYAARLHGGRWHLLAPLDVPGATGTSFASVSCPTRRVCTAVGQSLGPDDPSAGTGPLNPLAERWVAGGRRWRRHHR
jgi:hypothetical protein